MVSLEVGLELLEIEVVLVAKLIRTSLPRNMDGTQAGSHSHRFLHRSSGGADRRSRTPSAHKVE